MIKILLTDTHFGVRNNSITWLTAQSNFIYNQLIPFIETLEDEIYIYHLGDVFDSRSSINPYIANTVRNIFINLSSKVNHVYIIAGNHDYYSPTNSSINTIDLLLSNINNVTLITKDIFVREEDMFIPWFEFSNINNIKNKIDDKIRNIYCHSNIFELDDEHKQIFKDLNVYSGHIHTPGFQNNLYNLGAVYSLTFSDNNSNRGFYVLKDSKLDFHKNIYNINFWRLYNEDIFSFDINILSKNDYIEIYVYETNLVIDCYIKRIEEFYNCSRNTVILPVLNTSNNNVDIDFTGYDIEKICIEQIPENLRSKFNLLLNSI